MANKLKVITTAAVLSVFLQGCSLFSDNEDVYSPLPVIQAKFTPEVEWRKSIGSGVGEYYSQTRTLLANDQLFAASRAGIVKALDPISGDVIWQQDLAVQAVFNRFDDSDNALLSGGIAAGYGMVFVGSENAVLFALNDKTGEVIWQVETDGEVIASPVVDEGLVIIQTGSGSLVGFDVQTGEQRWIQSAELPALTLRGNNSPITTNGAAIYGRSDGKLAAVFIANGRLIWEVSVAKPKGANDIDRLVDVNGQAVARGTDVYTSAFNGELMAVELRSGKVLWKRAYASVKDLTVAGFELFLTDTEGRIHAIDRRNGLTLWSQNRLALRGVTAPVVSGDNIVVGDKEGYLHWLDRKTGQLVAQQLIDSDGLFSKALNSDEYLYVQSRSGELVAVKKPI
ncbi:MAG: outer membrane protein assembly factor BamB [Moritella dasanensis]|jgi:outer membrane protein assembly factor BamB